MSFSPIGFVQSSGLAQPSFSAAALTRQEVSQVGALMLHSTAFGELEPLGSAPRGLNFWHGSSTQSATHSLSFLGFRPRLSVLSHGAVEGQSARRQQDRHVAALHAGVAFRLSDVPDLFDNSLDQTSS